jgi:DNA-binding MarR family transcriptional regulator
MVSAKDKQIEDILNLSNKITIELLPTMPRDLPLPDLTMKQFRIAMFLFVGESMRMSCIAEILGVSMATATGIVNRLVEQDIVQREHDLEDRRAVICQLSPHGRNLLSQTWQSFRDNAKRTLLAIPVDKLNLVREALMMLLETAKSGKQNMIRECDK